MAATRFSSQPPPQSALEHLYHINEVPFSLIRSISLNTLPQSGQAFAISITETILRPIFVFSAIIAHLPF
jgi:hypothetical protein